MNSKRISTPVLVEYVKENNIEYNFFLVVEYKIGSLFNIDVKKERVFIYMTDSNDNFLQVEELDGVNDDVLYEEHIIPIAKRFVREQRLKEIGI